jgi:hypothetical protein
VRRMWGGLFQGNAQVKSILDPSFQYTPSLQTDVRKTFDRVRREQEEASRDDPGARVVLIPRYRATPSSNRRDGVRLVSLPPRIAYREIGSHARQASLFLTRIWT